MRTQFLGDSEGLRARLGQVLEVAGVSPNAASELAGTARASVGFIINGKIKNPTVGVLDSIANVFDVSLDWLVRNQGEMPPAEQIRTAVERARLAKRSPRRAAA